MQAGTTNKALSSHESDASFYRKKSKLVLHPNGALAASIDSHFQVQLLDVATQKVLCVLGKPRATRNVLLRHFVCGLSFHPREPYLAVAGADEIVRIFDIEAGFLCQVLAEHTDRVCCAEFSPSGDILATGGYDRCEARRRKGSLREGRAPGFLRHGTPRPAVVLIFRLAGKKRSRSLGHFGSIFLSHFAKSISCRIGVAMPTPEC